MPSRTMLIEKLALAFSWIWLSLLLTGCRATSVLPPLPHAVGSLALSPSGGVFADAVGVQLFAEGFTVIDTAEFSNLLLRDNLAEIEIFEPSALGRLRERGIDAVLSVRVVEGYRGSVESASARVTSTHDGQVIAGYVLSGKPGAGMNWAALRVARVLAKMLRRPVTEVAVPRSP